MNPAELESMLSSGLLSFPVTDLDEEGTFRPDSYAARSPRLRHPLPGRRRSDAPVPAGLDREAAPLPGGKFSDQRNARAQVREANDGS